MDERAARLALHLIPGIGRTLSSRLIHHFGGASQLFQASFKELLRVEGIGEKTASEVVRFNVEEAVKQEFHLMERVGASFLTQDDEAYPEQLKTIFDPPLILYVKGAVREEDGVAIALVGSRKPTPYGRMVAEKLGRELAERGMTVVSGMARGIDSFAHRGALSGKGRTLAVFGSGVDMIYPPEHRTLSEEIARHGALLSEFPMGTTPERINFPIRNRLISGLTLGTIVVEAAEKSGSLITAQAALDQGREVFAVPGNIHSTNSQGTHRLIQMGAKLVQSIDDVLEELPHDVKAQLVQRSPTSSEVRAPQLSQDEQTIYHLLEGDGQHIDTIIQRSQLPSGQVSALLVRLELRGLVQQLSGKIFVRSI